MKKAPLIIIGIDAGDPKLLERWAADGTMPNLNRIMQSGCWGQPSGKELLFEHGVWLSIITGVSRREHGYYHYRQLRSNAYDLELVSGNKLPVAPFWNAFKGTGKKAAIIDVPESSAIPEVEGIQLIDWAVHDAQSSAAAHPPGLLEDVRLQFGEQIIVEEQFESDLETDTVLYRQLMNRIEKKSLLCQSLLAGDEYDLVFLVFAEAHTGGHQFWKYRPDASGLEKVAIPNPLMDGVRDIYQAVDREIGILLEQLPNEANVFVLSSVGLQDHYPMGGLIQDFCFKLGYQARSEPAAVPRSPLDWGRRLLPESWRIAASKHLLSRESRERIVSNQFSGGTDWSQTTAFATPSTFMSFLWANLRGRQPQGIVDPGQEYEELLHKLSEDLRLLIDPQTNETAVLQVWPSCAIFEIDPRCFRLPDLLVEWKPRPTFIERLHHPRAELMQKKPEFFRGSDHIRSGFIAAAGPSITGQQYIGDLDVLDLAPTFLHMLGAPASQEMTGQLIPQFTNDNVG